MVFSDIGLLALRLVLGIILVFHGWPKIKDLKQTAAGFESMGFKPGIFWGTLTAKLEFFGGLLLIAGFLTQIVSALLVIQFIVIILKLKRKQKLVAGYEFDLLISAAALLLVTLGPGAYSLEGYFRFWLY